MKPLRKSGSKLVKRPPSARVLAAAAEMAGPEVWWFHVGVECWVLKEILYWNFTVPPGFKLARVVGECSAAPVAGGDKFPGVVRQALMWWMPLQSQPGARYKGTPMGYTAKPPATKAASEYDRIPVVVIMKVAGVESVHLEIDRDYRESPVEVPGGLIRMNYVPTAHYSDGASWRESDNPLQAIDAEYQLHGWCVR